ncbi:MAG: hypothetical protein ACXVP0_16125 [Bacteroidia bacterium]
MKTIKTLAICAAIVGAFCFGKAYQEKHPHMTAAKTKLEEAKAQLQKAAHDYSGHRTKAVSFVDQAIKEINDGIASDKK